MIKIIQRYEGLAIFILSIFFYSAFQNWIPLVIGILLVDVSMVGYLKNPKLGATIYNLFHNYIIGITAILIGFILNVSWPTMIGLILTAHVGIDRFFGFGIKYPDSFKHTHLS